MGGRGGAAGGGGGGSASSMTEVKDRIRAAYDALPHAPGGWVGLAELRDKLGGIPRTAVDRALGQISLEKGVRLATVDNTRSLRPVDRKAALHLGDSERHMLAMRLP